MATEKLQKVLAALGFGSRRQLEQWIVDGRVLVDGQRAQLGDRVSASASITVDGHQVVRAQLPHQCILYHKPEGEICTRSDPQGRPTVFDHLPDCAPYRWVLIGRLDLNTQGLLLLTTDGAFAHQMMHPRTGVEREYRVRVLGTCTPAIQARLTQGVDLDGRRAAFQSITYESGQGANRWYRVVLTEGRYREVRRLFESQGLKVSRLIRMRFGSYTLPKDLLPGQYIRVPF